MADSFTYDVFLSHNRQDKPRVRALAGRLKEAGLQVWLDDWVIKPGDDIYLAIERGLESARVQVLCLSPAALGSDWVALERSTVLFRDPSNAGRRFIPLLLADCDLPDTLRRYKYVDFRQETSDAFEELLNACREGAEAETPPVQRDTKKEPAKPKPETPEKQAEPLAVLERKLEGHKGRVNSVAVSPDGKWAASGSHDNTVKVWDLETGECLKTLKGHTDWVQSVAITQDGKQILSGSNDHTFRIWDVDSGQEQAKLEEHTSWVRSLAALPNDKHVLSSQDIYNGVVSLKLWDIASHSCIKTFYCGTEEADGVFSLAVYQTGMQALSSDRGGRIRLWNLETGECLATLRGHSKTVSSIQITPNGRFAVSGSDDKTVKVWDLEAGTCIGTLEGHQNKVHSVAISPDGTLIASTGFTDETVRLWDLKSGVCLQVIEHDGAPSPVSVAFSPDGARFVVGTSSGGTIYVYRLAGVRVAPSAESTRRYVNAKVVLLGEGSVGKTSLAYRLIDDKYVVKDRTHGMNVWLLPLPLPPDAILDREALLWDLAGQEDYRLIHPLFLDETALALLLINPQKDDPFTESGDWLRALDTATNLAAKRKAERLLIFSQVDVGGMKVSNAKIERFMKEQGFADCLATSAKSGQNCSDAANGGKPSRLKQLIAERIPWDKLPWTATPRLLAEMKEALMKMRDTADIRLLRFSELAQRIEQALPNERFGQSDMRTAVSLLANLGLALPL